GTGGADRPGVGGGAASGTGGSGGAGAGGVTGGGGGATGGAAAAGVGGAGGTGTGGSSGMGGAQTGAGTGGAAGDPCATALFCDDFEKYTAGQAPGAPWSHQVSAGSTAAVDTSQFHSGSKSVMFVAASGSGSK